MTQTPQDNHTPDEPRISANQWYALAVSGAILAVIGFVIAFAWVFWANDPHPINERAQAVAPFGAAAIAVVTFLTIAWRGVQTDHQLRQQAAQVRFQGDQLAQVVRQNDAKEEENLVKVLQEGAKLIADPEKPSQILAGISSLEYLVMKKSQPFSIQAADLLANLLMDVYDPNNVKRITRAVYSALLKCEAENVSPTIMGEFSRPSGEATRDAFWGEIPAFKKVSFTGGTLRGGVFEKMRPRLTKLTNVRLFNCNVGRVNNIFNDCLFENCKIQEISALNLHLHEFKECDFSDATIDNRDHYPITGVDLKKGLNYYEEGRPPRTIDGGYILNNFLTAKEYYNNPDVVPF